MKFLRVALISVLFLTSQLQAAEQTLMVYGPGGPAPAMKEVAEAFYKKTGIKAVIISGPTAKWKDQAQKDADVFYSGSESMMDAFVKDFNRINTKSIVTHYLRPAVILSRPGNPKQIKGLIDLLSKELKILTVEGSGQAGLWEDIVGRTQDVKNLNTFRRKIVFSAPNTGEAEKFWNEHSEVDAWLVFNTWHLSNPKASDMISIEKPYEIYRSTGTATTSGMKQAEKKKFVDFIETDESLKIFEKAGWIRSRPL